MKKLSTLFLSLLMAAGISSSAQGTATTIDFTDDTSRGNITVGGGGANDFTWTTATKIPTVNYTVGDITIGDFTKGGTNDPVFNINKNAGNVRIYKGGSFTVTSADKDIVEINFKFHQANSNKGTAALKVTDDSGNDIGTITDSNVASTGTAKWVGPATKSVKFSVAANIFIQKITVVTPKAYWYKFDSDGVENWEAPLVWAWNDGGDLITGKWPGTTKMQATGEERTYGSNKKEVIYIIDFDDEPTGIQFIAKDESKAGGDNIKNPVNHATYKSDASAVDENGNPIEAKEITLYFDNRETKWSTVKYYTSAMSGDKWPGEDMTLADGKKYIYQVKVSDGIDFIIFNNGSSQTDDIKAFKDGDIFKWTGDKQQENLGTYDPANFPEGDEPGPGPEPEVDHWYLVGEATGWALDESMELTAVDGSENVFSITLPSLAGEWKIWNGAWGNAGGKAFGPGLETSAASGVAIDAWCNGLSNDNFNFPIKPETEVTITLTIPEGAAESSASVAAQLVVDYTSAEETLLIPEKLGVLSTPWFTGNNAVTEMAYDEATNTFSIDNYEVGEDVPAANALADGPATQKDGYVQFGVNTQATSWEELNQAHRYGAETDGTALQFSGDMAEADVKHFAANPGMCHPFKLAPGKYDLAVKFNPEDKSIKLTAKVTPTGVENVSIDADNEADAEYFNLQGVKVAEPSNGIFIRRANGKTTKVFVK